MTSTIQVRAFLMEPFVSSEEPEEGEGEEGAEEEEEEDAAERIQPVGEVASYLAKEAISGGLVVDAMVQLAAGVSSSSITVGRMFDIQTVVRQTIDGGVPLTKLRLMRGRVTNVTFATPPSDTPNRDVVAIRMESTIRLLSKYRLFKTYKPASSYTVLRDMVAATLGEQAVTIGGNFSSRDAFPGASRYLVQTGENCWAFVQRILSDDSTSFIVTPSRDGGEAIVIGDGFAITNRDDVTPQTTGLTGLGDLLIKRVYRYQLGGVGEEFAYSYASGQVNKLLPVAIEGATPATGVTEFNQSLISSAQLTKRADSRRKSNQSRSWKVKLLTSDPSLTPGTGLNLSSGSEIGGRGRLIVDYVEHRLAGGRYVNKVSCRDGSLPWGPVPMQDAGSAMTVIARIHGGADAVEGDYVNSDRLGHLPVVFPWDENAVFGNAPPAPEGESSGESLDGRVWVRVSQLMSGSEHGSSFKARHAEEVVIQLVQGNPDSAVILGRLYYQGNQMPEVLQQSSAGMVFTLDASDAQKFTGIVFKRLDEDGDPADGELEPPSGGNAPPPPPPPSA